MFLKHSIIALFVHQILTCTYLIQKFQLPEQYIIIQSECEFKQILEIDTERNVDFTHLSENQIMISANLIYEESEYLVTQLNEYGNKINNRIRIVQNTDQLKSIQDKVNEEGVHTLYQIVVENLKIDTISAFIKGLLLILL